MNTRCECGCRRHTDGEWLHPTFGALTFAALCNLRHKPALEDQGWAYFPPLDDRDDELPQVTMTGGTMDADC